MINQKILNKIYSKSLENVFQNNGWIDFHDEDFFERVYVITDNGNQNEFKSLEEFYHYLIAEHNFMFDEIYVHKFDNTREELVPIYNSNENYSEKLVDFLNIQKEIIENLEESDLIKII